MSSDVVFFVTSLERLANAAERDFVRALAALLFLDAALALLSSVRARSDCSHWHCLEASLGTRQEARHRFRPPSIPVMARIIVVEARGWSAVAAFPASDVRVSFGACAPQIGLCARRASLRTPAKPRVESLSRIFEKSQCSVDLPIDPARSRPGTFIVLTSWSLSGSSFYHAALVT